MTILEVAGALLVLIALTAWRFSKEEKRISVEERSKGFDAPWNMK